MSGGVLLSHDLPVAVPSALSGLTSRFGMETGCFPDAMATETLSKYQPTTCWLTTPLGVLVAGVDRISGTVQWTRMLLFVT
jgi:hypothetical protein